MKILKFKKSSVLLFVLSTILVIGFGSCNKNEMNEDLSTKDQSVTYFLDKVPIKSVKSNSKNAVTDINTLMTNPDDLDDEKINNYLYQLSLATRELIKDANFNQVIIEMAQNSETKTANLLDLEIVAPNYFYAINIKLAENDLSLQTIANDLTHEPIAPNESYPITAVTEHYVPAIFIPNIESVNASLQPIISPNIEVDSRDDESIEDNIIAWFYQTQNDSSVTEIMLSEETVENTTNPIFLLDNAVTTLATEQDLNFTPYISEREIAAAGSTTGTRSFSSYEHSIESQSYRYESGWSGKSEFTVTAIRIDPNDTNHLVYQTNSGTYKTWQNISDIKKNEIGTLRYNWRYHASDWQPWSNPWTPNVIQTGVNMVFWNTFERDWNRSEKALGTCEANNSTIYLKGNMKYSDNWYTWIPSTSQIHYTRFQWLDSDWAHWNNSWKAKFRLWKVYI